MTSSGKGDLVEDDDVVVTGIGVLSPLGNDLETHLAKLLAGESAVQIAEPIHGVDGDFWLAASIRDFDPKQHVQPRKAIKVMCREIQLSFGSAMQACKHAQLSAGVADPDRIGTVFSGEIILSDLSDVEEIVRRCETDGVMLHERWSYEAMENMYPLWMLRSLPNMAACHVGIALDARGPNNTITTEGTSGMAAMQEAIHVIRRGQADVMVVGSTASRHNPSRLLQRYEEDYSRNYSDGAAACKPFDITRDGTVAAEASSCVVLERRRHAIARGVPILATIRSYSNTFASRNMEHWSGTEEGTRIALEQLMERSGLPAERIDHINAAASGTVRGDAAEARGIEKVLPTTPVVSYKGALGDSISGSGLIEWISSLQGMLGGVIPSTVNHRKTAPDCPISVVHGAGKERTTDTFIKLSNTPTGRCAGLVTTLEQA